MTPNIRNGLTWAIHDAGTKVIAGGTFTTVRSRNSSTDIARPYLLAFNKANGVVDEAFKPVLDDEVNAVIAGPTPDTVYIAGRFNTIDGVNWPKIALLNVADGSRVTTFDAPPFNGQVMDIVLAGSRLLVGGAFTTVGGVAHGGLVALDAATGAVDPAYLTVDLTEHHNWNGSGASAPIGADRLALSPNGTQLVVIGNFKRADGVVHDQVVKLDLGPTAATIANWNTAEYQDRCLASAFDSYVRDVSYSPDGSYFVIATTGARFANSLCDTAARWSSTATGTNLTPTWASFSGGDTILSVAISEQAIYVGGHMRWMNNSDGSDTAGPGAVPRPSLAALDPISGVPLAWNPGRHPRGFGVSELRVTPEGLWIGHDTARMGNNALQRERIAFLPLAGGLAPHSTAVPGLPGKIYFAGAGSPSSVLYRVNAGGPAVASIDGGPAWAADTAATPSPYVNSATTNVTSYATTIPSLHSTVPGTTPAAVFNEERWDPATAPEMQWDFPVTAGAAIDVRLYLANRWPSTGQVGKRKFNVNIDGVNKLASFDPVAAVGHDRGMMAAFPITSDGNVDIDFGHVVENPNIFAIEIVAVLPPSAANAVSVRSYDGSTVGPTSPVANPDGTAWSTARGGFWVGGTLFYLMNNTMYRRTFDGTTFGPSTVVDPYHDPLWDTVLTNSGPTGQTYAGATTSFYAEIPSVTAIYYRPGRMYYTLNGQSALYYRLFSPDSGAISSTRVTLGGTNQFLQAGGLWVSGSRLYMVNRVTGTLSWINWTGGVSGPATVLSGPGVDGVDWRGKAVFIGP
jgi:hypothetical protein